MNTCAEDSIDAMLANVSPQIRQEVQNYVLFELERHAIDAELFALAAELDASHSDLLRLDGDPTATAADYDRAFARRSRVITKIEAIPAHTLAGLRVKARAIAYLHAGDTPISLVERPTTDIWLAQSIIADLLREPTGGLKYNK